MSIFTHSALVWVTIDGFHGENVTIKQLKTQGNECFRVVSFFILARNSVAVFLMLSLSLISFLSLLSSTCGLYYIIGKSVNLESSFGGRGPGRLSLIPRWQMLVENLCPFVLWKYSHSVCSKPDMNKQHFSTTDATAVEAFWYYYISRKLIRDMLHHLFAKWISLAVYIKKYSFFWTSSTPSIFLYLPVDVVIIYS